MNEEGCICQGNWRSLVKQYDPFIDKEFVMEGKKYYFFGLVHGSDDYYFAMSNEESHVSLYSCACNLEAYGFVLIKKAE